MAQPSSTSNFDDRRLWRAIKLTLALVALVELALSFVPENNLVRSMRGMRASLVSEPAPVVQFNGDSVVQGGLLASEVAAQLPPGVTVNNAAVAGTGPEFTYFLLASQIAAGRAPRVLVLAHSPHTLVTERFSVLAGAMLRWSELPGAFVASHHPFEMLYGVLCRLSFTLRHRDEIGDLAKGHRDAFSGWNEPVPTETVVRENLAHEEAVLKRKGPNPLGPMSPAFQQPFVLDPGVREYLDRTLALARANGITVFWLTPPENEVLAPVRAADGFTADYYAFVDGLAARGDVRVLRRDFEVLPKDHFRDYTHLSPSETFTFSRQVGRELAAAGVR